MLGLELPASAVLVCVSYLWCVSVSVTVCVCVIVGCLLCCTKAELNLFGSSGWLDIIMVSGILFFVFENISVARSRVKPVLSLFGVGISNDYTKGVLEQKTKHP